MLNQRSTATPLLSKQINHKGSKGSIKIIINTRTAFHCRNSTYIPLVLANFEHTITQSSSDLYRVQMEWHLPRISPETCRYFLVSHS
jgi:hypothetical protein